MAKKPKKKKSPSELTTAERLSAVVKTCRKVMRKDKGLSTDLDRLPLLTWIMFLKFLDDLEQIEESRAKLSRKKHRPMLLAPYRWRDWAAQDDGITGPELLAFINHEEANLPDGSRGPGLFAYLRALEAHDGATDRRQVIASVFSRISCRVESGYLLRDVINSVNTIHFLEQEELFVLGHLYESMIKEMRDAAGENGEFYTPRPVVRFMIDALDPRLGETVMDPACGTGGFLVDAFAHLEQQAQTVEDRKVLQTQAVVGGEAKPLPYLMCQMNLLLHGVEAPRIDPENSLRHNLSEIGDRERVDIVLTNPPFGGEEEKGILNNFPADLQTAETTLLFLQLIMRRLRRPSSGSPGRAGVIVPNTTLYADGVCARVKAALLSEFNLHTVVRLPEGVFEPYTPIPTNILFFDRSHPTEHVWFYEVKPADGRKKYTKTTPLKYEELQPALEWYNSDRTAENENAWRVSASDLLAQGCNLDIRNPNRADQFALPAPSVVTARMLDQAAQQMAALQQLQREADTLAGLDIQETWDRVELSELLTHVEDVHEVVASESYPNLGIFSFGKGLFSKPPIDGLTTSATRLFRVHKDQFIYSRLFAFEGSYGLVTEEFDKCFVSNEYPTFDCDQSRLLPSFLYAYFRSPRVWDEISEKSKGLGNRRQRVHPETILEHRIPLPPIEIQDLVCRVMSATEELAARRESLSEHSAELLPSFLDAALGVELVQRVTELARE